MDNRTRFKLAAICAAFACLVMAPVLAVVASGELAYHPEKVAAEVLAVSDKPMPAAVEAAEEAEEEMEAQEEAYYYAPVYGGSVWYESDDADAEAAAKEWIAFRESGGDYDARNGQYVGKFQLQQDMLGDDLSPEHQEERADEYVASRYGSWQAAKEFHEQNGWY